MISNNLRLFALFTVDLMAPTAVSQQPATQGQHWRHESPRASGKSSQAKTFLHKASMGGHAEDQLEQLAAQKGSSDEVKKFGQKMVDDYTALNDSLKPFADTMGVPAPANLDPKNQAEYDKLNGLSGEDFDK